MHTQQKNMTGFIFDAAQISLGEVAKEAYVEHGPPLKGLVLGPFSSLQEGVDPLKVHNHCLGQSGIVAQVNAVKGSVDKEGLGDALTLSSHCAFANFVKLERKVSQIGQEAQVFRHLDEGVFVQVEVHESDEKSQPVRVFNPVATKIELNDIDKSAQHVRNSLEVVLRHAQLLQRSGERAKNVDFQIIAVEVELRQPDEGRYVMGALQCTPRHMQ